MVVVVVVVVCVFMCCVVCCCVLLCTVVRFSGDREQGMKNTSHACACDEDIGVGMTR